LFELPDTATATLIGSGNVNVLLALKLALKDLIENDPDLSGSSPLPVGAVSIFTASPPASPNEIMYQIDFASLEDANRMAAALISSSGYFDFVLNEDLDGSIADAGLAPKTGLIRSSFRDGFPKVEESNIPTTFQPTMPPSGVSVPPTLPPGTSTPAPSSNSPTTTTTTSAPTTPHPTPTTTTTSAPTSSTTTTPSSPSAAPTTSPTKKHATPSSSSLSPGAIAGITIGTILGVLAMCVVPCFCWFGPASKRKRQLNEQELLRNRQRQSPMSSDGELAATAVVGENGKAKNDSPHEASDDDNTKTVVDDDESNDATYANLM
jgi:hypothetical protein